MVHTKYWALAVGQRATRSGRRCVGGITMASTRYWMGDGFTAEDYAATASLTPGSTAQRLVSDVADLLGPDACVVQPRARRARVDGQRRRRRRCAVEPGVREAVAVPRPWKPYSPFQ